MNMTVQNRQQPQTGGPPGGPRPRPRRRQSRAQRRGGYLVSILINAVLIYLLRAHPSWHALPFLTSATDRVIGLVTLTLAAGIAANVVYYIADPPRLRALGDLVTLTITLVTTVRVLDVFPFAFHGSWAFCSVLVRVILIIGIVGESLGLLYSLGVLIKGKKRTAP